MTRQTRAILESMKLDSNAELKHLMVDGGMTNGDMVMKVLADIGGFTVIRPEMRECVLFLSFTLSSPLSFPPPCVPSALFPSLLLLLLLLPCSYAGH